MLWGRDQIIEQFEPMWKIANESPRLCVENLEMDQWLGSILENQYRFLLMHSFVYLSC